MRHRSFVHGIRYEPPGDRRAVDGADEVVTRALASNSDSGRRQAVGSSGVLDSALIGSALYPCIADGGILACVRTFDGAPPERGIRVREV